MGGAGLGYRQIIIKQFSRTRLQGQTLYANKLFVGTMGVIISPILFLESKHHTTDSVWVRTSTQVTHCV